VQLELGDLAHLWLDGSELLGESFCTLLYGLDRFAWFILTYLRISPDMAHGARSIAILSRHFRCLFLQTAISIGRAGEGMSVEFSGLGRGDWRPA
jgi:hypothetical protein